MLRPPPRSTLFPLHDALPISNIAEAWRKRRYEAAFIVKLSDAESEDRKSTRLNSSHVAISYAVFCLKKKNVIEPENRAERGHQADDDRHQPGAATAGRQRPFR